MDAAGPQGNDALQRLASQLRSSIRSWKGVPRRPRSRRLEHWWLLCWLLKDLGWVLLCGPLAWPAALAAIAFQARDLLQQWQAVPVCEWVHSLATLAWLSGSTVWMTAQLLFEPEVHKNRSSPWYSGALFAANADRYHKGVILMQTIDFATLLGLALFYGVSSYEAGLAAQTVIVPGAEASCRSSPFSRKPLRASPENAAAAAQKSAQALVFGLLTPDVYAKIFIVPWILKDIFWSRQSFIPTIICMLLVTILMADNLWLFMRQRNVALIFWVTGSAVWMSNDLVMHDQEVWPLFLSVLLLAVGACTLVLGESEFADSPMGESDPLL